MKRIYTFMICAYILLWLWFINRKKVKVINKKKINFNKGLYFNKYEYSNY